MGGRNKAVMGGRYKAVMGGPNKAVIGGRAGVSESDTSRSTAYDRL
jgi:hypothetical protein